jgi:hypothetical protein
MVGRRRRKGEERRGRARAREGDGERERARESDGGRWRAVEGGGAMESDGERKRFQQVVSLSNVLNVGFGDGVPVLEVVDVQTRLDLFYRCDAANCTRVHCLGKRKKADGEMEGERRQ